jgi:hypothetical protein
MVGKSEIVREVISHFSRIVNMKRQFFFMMVCPATLEPPPPPPGGGTYERDSLALSDS